MLLATLLATILSQNPPPPTSYACDGVTAAYVVNFPYAAYTDLVVTSTTAGNFVTTLVYTTDYTISATSTTTSATLTLQAPASSCPSGNTLKINRSTPRTQPTNFAAQTTYSPSLHTKVADRLEMQIQELSSLVLGSTISFGPGQLFANSPLIGDGSSANHLRWDFTVGNTWTATQAFNPGAGVAVAAVGGPNSAGGTFVGSGIGVGAQVQGGASGNSSGLLAYGGGPNGVGVTGIGTGGGNGAVFTGGSLGGDGFSATGASVTSGAGSAGGIVTGGNGSGTYQNGDGLDVASGSGGIGTITGYVLNLVQSNTIRATIGQTVLAADPSILVDGDTWFSGTGQNRRGLANLNSTKMIYVGNPALYAYSTAGQTIATSTLTTVVYGTVVTNTSTTECAGSTNCYNSATGVYTVPPNKGGTYLIVCSVAWAAGFTATTVSLSVSRNATTGSAGDFTAATVNPTATSTLVVTGMGAYSAGDTLQCQVTQNQGGNESLSTAVSSNYISIKRLSD